jgi:hypothetical protein
VGEHVDGRGEGLGGDEARAGVVDFLERLHDGLEFGEIGPLGELAGRCEHLAGERFGGGRGVQEDVEGGAEWRVREFRVEVGVALGGWGVACVCGDHAEKLHAGRGKARGKVGMYHEFARAGGQYGQICGSDGSGAANDKLETNSIEVRRRTSMGRERATSMLPAPDIRLA